MCLVCGYVTLINPYDERLISLENSGRKWRKLKSLSHHAMAKTLHWTLIVTKKSPCRNKEVSLQTTLAVRQQNFLLYSRKTLLSVPKASEKKCKTFLFHGRAGKSIWSYFPISWWKYRERLRGLDHVRAKNSITKNVLSSYFLSISWYGVTNELWCYLRGIV